MDMNRPILEEDERASNSSRQSLRETPIDSEMTANKSRNESTLNETGVNIDESNQLIDETDQEGKLFHENDDGGEKPVPIEEGEHLEETEQPTDGDTSIGEEEKEEKENEETKEEENTHTLNESESVLDNTNLEMTAATAAEVAPDDALASDGDSERQQQSKQEEVETESSKEAIANNQQQQTMKKDTVYQKKEAVKRKARQPKRFGDGNLIPEEDDDQETERRISPGPPPLEPISQVLDHEPLDKSLTHGKHEYDLVATTPEKMDVTLDEDYQEVEVDVKPTREELIARFHAAMEEKERIQNINNQLSHKLADYFRRKKSEDTQNQGLFEKTTQEQEQRYSKYLGTVESLKKEMDREKIEAERKLNELKYKCEAKEDTVEQERMKMTKFKKDTGLKAVYAQNGKRLASKEIDFYLERERQKELEVISYRIENIKLTNQLKKSQEERKQKENMGDTKLEMIDFEQLKIENQTYNEKIEERNEELLKLKKKINNTVQISAHVKEKLQNVLAENEKQKEHLAVYDDRVKKSRDMLNKIKQSKDSLRNDNARLKQKCGLLGNNVLLRDFEDCVDSTESLEYQIEQMKRHHAELTLNSKALKQRITQVAKQDHDT